MSRWLRRLNLLSLLCLPGCTSHPQSSLDPKGIQAGQIEQLWWLFFWICFLVFVLVMAFVASAVLRRRLPAQVHAGDAPEADDVPTPETSPPLARERRLGQTVIGAVILTLIILFALVFADFLTGRTLQSLEDSETLVIEVKAHQWWWQFRYQDADPSKLFETANEIHIPVGRTVRFDLDSSDVIHSFWVPNLHGKKDIIPGHPAKIWLRADEPGTYWGQCAEFCGQQHATMRFTVVAVSEQEFQDWVEAQRKPAPEPMTEGQQKDWLVFMNTTCVMCHTIQGTPARGAVGPDLTHLASRSKIASGTLPNTRGHLAGWVMDPQQIRPGVRMPLNPLSPEELRNLLDYLESLK